MSVAFLINVLLIIIYFIKIMFIYVYIEINEARNN